MARRPSLRSGDTPEATAPAPGPDATSEHHHRNIQGGAVRAAVFGISDGLVSNVSLILGVAGADPAPGVVRLAGLAGLVGGAFSMAAGEYVSMKAQSELLERELELERIEIRRRPENERRELAAIYRERGVAADVADELATHMMRDPDLALETHAREELGIDPNELGSPAQAALSSFLAFAFGALLPLLPWFVTKGAAATFASVIIGASSAVGIGLALAAFTGRSPARSAVRQLAIAAAAAGVTYLVGKAVGVSGLT
ncbi:MAG: VIT1/CCC1 transporter family protein [Acidimicrobiales bacterium]